MKKHEPIFLNEYTRIFTKMGVPLHSSVEEAVEAKLKDRLVSQLLHQLRMNVKRCLLELK